MPVALTDHALFDPATAPLGTDVMSAADMEASLQLLADRDYWLKSKIVGAALAFEHLVEIPLIPVDVTTGWAQSNAHEPSWVNTDSTVLHNLYFPIKAEPHGAVGATAHPLISHLYALVMFEGGAPPAWPRASMPQLGLYGDTCAIGTTARAPLSAALGTDAAASAVEFAKFRWITATPIIDAYLTYTTLWYALLTAGTQVGNDPGFTVYKLFAGITGEV